MVQCCIFDMVQASTDGLLLNTEDIYSLVTQRIVERYGKNYDWTLKSQMMGMRQLEAAKLLVDTLKIPLTPEEYLAERNYQQSLLFPDCEPLPGVIRLVEHLKKHKIPMAVATSSHKDHFDLKTQRHQKLFQLFDCIVTGDQVTKGKPHPDIFIEAAKRLGHSDVEKCLVFEDAPSGVQAAINAGMKICWVPDKRVDKKGLESQVDLLIYSLQDFDPSRFGLPAFSD